MFHVPEFYPNISLKLSSVLEEIGVNERMILKRRRTWLLKETLNNILNKLRGLNCSYHYFGSKSEGTTTPGLHSDTDNLMCNHDCSVIQDWEEWEPGLLNLLMIQEETTPPGYCMLQMLYTDEPTAVTDVFKECHVRYRGDKVLFKNNFIDKIILVDGRTKHGPAGTDSKREGFCDQDYVFAIPFKTLPAFLTTWIQQQTQQGNLSQDMKRYIEYSPCYVVPVGRKDSPFEVAEWRISTSHAERCLMLNLNITQIQCYILLKLILKTYLKHPYEKALSSFMCKNILLLCIAKTHPSKWSPQNLLSVFRYCLLQLKRSVQHEHCQHFIMSENNLMAKKFKPEIKSWLLEKIQFICDSHGCALLGVKIDDIGRRLQFRLNILRHITDIQVDQSARISGELLYNLANTVITKYKHLRSIQLAKNSFNGIITTLAQLNHHESDLEKAASRLLTPLICSSLGSVIASRDMHQHRSVSPEAINWLSLGLNSDVSSARLKLASVYYCVSDFNKTETILSTIAETYDQRIVEAVCGCYDHGGLSCSARFVNYANSHDEYSIRHVVAFCVTFLPDEVHCQPRELQYEMFRSTQEELANRGKDLDLWMDWAVVDSLPFLYFLQYKTYGHLQKFYQQQQALENLIRSIHREENYGHKETALNLLGQCYQQENKNTEALHCYMNSLNVRPSNNAARLHICRLLYAIYSS